MTLRQLWDSGQPTLGGWCVIPGSFGAELMGTAGFDWVCIDTQHGLIGYDEMLTMLQALSSTRTPSFVRVRWNEPGEIMKALDAGAEGVIVPMVNSAADARAAVGACRYHPEGYRSWGPTRAALQVKNYDPQSANRAVICAVMVETAEAVRQLDDILSVPGLDAVFVGPNDLAVSSGIAPSYDAEDAEHRRLIEEILGGCQRTGTLAGIYCGSAETAARWRERGFRMLAVASDAVLLRLGAQQGLRQLRREERQEAPRASYA